MKKIVRKTTFFIMLFTVAVFVMDISVASSPASAESAAFAFDENNRYDIYFRDGITKGIRIMGTAKIHDELFLVIAISTLKNKDTQGYILFSSVTAVLPSGYISAGPVDGFRIK